MKREKLLEFIKRDNAKMRKAGCELAISAIKVAENYDGTHRLMLAVKKWCEVIANEGGRNKKLTKRDKHKEDEIRKPSNQFRIKPKIKRAWS